jgi:hypothetical protein
MKNPGDTIIHGSPFRVSLERTINLGNYESTRIGLAVDFMDAKPNEAFKIVQEILAPWVQELRPKSAAGTPLAEQKATESKPAKKSKACKYCGGMIYWQKDETGNWIPVNPDGFSHIPTCSKKP